MSREQVLGILGGMGPEATADFMVKIIRATRAKTDQQNIRMLVDCNPKVPSRVDAILHGKESSGPAMVEMAKGLERSGANLLVIACNTAHYYYQDVARAVQVPVLDLIAITAAHLRQSGVKDALVLGTQALAQSGLYEKALRQVGISMQRTDTEAQTYTESAIHAVKSGQMSVAFQHAARLARWCENCGVQQVILGCTELPIAFGGLECGLTLYDPGEIAAQAIVEQIKPRISDA